MHATLPANNFGRPVETHTALVSPAQSAVCHAWKSGGAFLKVPPDPLQSVLLLWFVSFPVKENMVMANNWFFP